MKNNGENRTSMLSRNRSKNNFKGALSCRFPFQNTVPCCDFKTVPKHNLAYAAGCANYGGLLPTWSATAFCVMFRVTYVPTKFNDHNLLQIFKAHSM